MSKKKLGKWDFLLIYVIVLLIMTAIFVSIDDSVELLGLKWVLSYSAISSLFISFPVYQALKQFQRKADEEQRKKEAEQIEKENKVASTIYERMINDFKIEEPSSSNDKDVLLIVARSFCSNISLEEAERLFQSGKKQYTEKLFRQEREKIEYARKQEEEKFQKQKTEADRVGKEKYTYIAKSNEKRDKAMEAIQSALIDRSISDMSAMSQKRDWATWGGVASALGGAGAGFAIASDIQAQNALAEQKASETRRQATQSLQFYLDHPVKHTYTYSDQEAVKHVESRLYSDANPDEWFKSLKISNVRCEITEGKNFAIQGEISCSNTFNLLDRLCILDGAIEILVYDSKKQAVAKGYFAAPGAGQMDLSIAGFYSGIVFQSLAIADNFQDIDKSETYTCIFKPYHMWLIEI